MCVSAALDRAPNRGPGPSLSRTLDDVAAHCPHLSAIEVWVLNRETGKLERRGGVCADSTVLSPREAEIARGLGPTPDPAPPGFGLAGALWSEGGATVEVDGGWDGLSDDGRLERLRAAAHAVPVDSSRKARFWLALRGDRVSWRDIRSMALDPDQHYDGRLEIAAEAGFKLAAGVRFSSRGHWGVVVYLTHGETDGRALKRSEAYLRAATGAIGSVAAELRGGGVV